MSDIAIRIENLGKQYRLGEFHRHRYSTLRESIQAAVSAPWRRLFGRNGSVQESPTTNAEEENDTIWALRDVSLEVPRGTVLGIIGRNGAGKSTLLKILSRITEPTTGRVEIHGRVGSLLEVGTGFHPELTGRENIFVNGSILGMTRREIKAKFDEIVAFSGIEKFLDTPVKRYSSGMSVRLAFAVAAHLDPEILVIDEVLAVGDAEFQSKCIRKMEDVAHHGRTVLFVSHNMAAIESLCNTATLLDEGRLVTLGHVPAVIAQYLKAACQTSSDIDLVSHPGRIPGYSPILRRLQILDSAGKGATNIPVGGDIWFEIHLASEKCLRGVELGIRFYGARGERVLTCHTRYQYSSKLAVHGEAVVRCQLSDCRLVPGVYRLALVVLSNGARVDMIDSGISLEISPRDIYGTGKLLPPKCGFVLPKVIWEVVRT